MKQCKIYIRFDDICPTMDWKLWEKAMRVLQENKLKALLGVIPDCKDPELMIDEPRADYWDYLKELQQQGFVLAMHGYQHRFVRRADGIVSRNKISEFAGLSYEEQFEKIRQGKDILISHGIDTDIFYAPAHNYDDNTLLALKACGFHYISDGLSCKPYVRCGIVCLPCRSKGIPKIRGNGNYTAVIHVHEWSRPDRKRAWPQYERFCTHYKEEITSFTEYLKSSRGIAIWEKVNEQMYRIARDRVLPFINKIRK